jgi:hypothetical protein
LSRGDLTDCEWRIFDPPLPDCGERGPPIKDNRRTVNGIVGAQARPGATCPSDTAIGTRPSCALRGEASSGCGMPLAKGNPLAFEVTGGEAHEVKGDEALMKLHATDPDRLLGDQGYDSDDIRTDLAKRGIKT